MHTSLKIGINLTLEQKYQPFEPILAVYSFSKYLQASLVAQGIRILLPMQETQLRSLIQEDAACCGATKPVCPNFCALWQGDTMTGTSTLDPVLHGKRSHCNEKPMNHSQRVVSAHQN